MKSLKRNIVKYVKGKMINVLDEVVVEKHIELFLNGEKYISIAATMEHLDLLSIGHLYTDDIIRNYEEIECIEIVEHRVYINLKNKKSIVKPDQLVTTGFGKGTVSSGSFIHFKESSCNYTYQITTEFIINKMNYFNSLSKLFQDTGGVHSCCLYDENEYKIQIDDIGRHNAVDKILGYILKNNLNLERCVLLTSGRLSSEIVMKTSKIGIKILVSRSAATDKAIEIAEKTGMTLVGFVRGEKFNIYHDANGIKK